jgi:hypothetical protein
MVQLEGNRLNPKFEMLLSKKQFMPRNIQLYLEDIVFQLSTIALN